jgi:hypothetical protein
VGRDGDSGNRFRSLDLLLNAGEARDVAAGWHLDPKGVCLAFVGVVSDQRLPDLVGLDSDDGILLRVEIGAPVVKVDAYCVLADTVRIPSKYLFAHELQESAFLLCFEKVPAKENAIELLAYL